MNLIEYGPLGIVAALGLAVTWTLAVTIFVLSLAAIHGIAGRLISRAPR